MFKRPTVIMRGFLVITLAILWAVSYPRIVGLDSSDHPRITIDMGSPDWGKIEALKGPAYERIYGRTFVYFGRTASHGFALLLWKGSIHFQWGLLEAFHFDNGLHLSGSDKSFMRASSDASAIQQLYIDKPLIDIMGFGWVSPAHWSIFPKYGVAIPIWPGIIILLIPWNCLKQYWRKRRSQGFEIT